MLQLRRAADLPPLMAVTPPVPDALRMQVLINVLTKKQLACLYVFAHPYVPDIIASESHALMSLLRRRHSRGRRACLQLCGSTCHVVAACSVRGAGCNGVGGQGLRWL